MPPATKTSSPDLEHDGKTRAARRSIDLRHIGAWAQEEDNKGHEAKSAGALTPQAQRLPEDKHKGYSPLERWLVQAVDEEPWNHVGAKSFTLAQGSTKSFGK
ncbi:hypothetical protein B0J14DRAFT_651110 [Halenospora varia]|nr:hypothetical protein B0J14DRAFT_651110 [Halenospora varia]